MYKLQTGGKKKKCNLSLKQPQPDCSSQFIRKEHIIFLKCEYFEIFFFSVFLVKIKERKNQVQFTRQVIAFQKTYS